MKALLKKDFDHKGKVYTKGTVINVTRQLQQWLFINGYLTETKVKSKKGIEYKSFKNKK